MSEAWRGEDENRPRFPFLSSMFGHVQLTPEQEAEFKKEYERVRDEGNMKAELLVRLNLEVKCPKCGHGKVKVRHCPGNLASCIKETGTTEHMHRECKRCKFIWYEKPLDTEVRS